MTVKALKTKPLLLPPEPPKLAEVYRVCSVKLPNIQTLFHDVFSGERVFPTFPDPQGAWHEFLCDESGAIIGCVPAFAADAVFHAPINLYREWCEECHQIIRDYGLDAILQLADLNKIFSKRKVIGNV